MYKYILLEIKERVAVLTLNRPEAGNAFARESYSEICDAIDECTANDIVGSIVLTGAGKNFCAGGDLKRFKTLIESGEYIGVDGILSAGEMVLAIRKCPKPVIAMVNGAAVGAGCSLALSCDFRFVSPNSRLMMSFIKLGLSGDTGGMFFLQRLVGTAKTLELMMLGETLYGEDAVRYGLASRCIESDSFEKETMEFAAKMAEGPLFGFARQKQLLMKYFYGGFSEYAKDEAESMSSCSRTADFAEAVDAFLEKRSPVFIGK